MFQAENLVFYSCVSPVHMGAGSAIGAIDNPIQREVHTDYPLIAGSGIKGAIRHFLSHDWPGHKGLIERLFGPEKDASLHAGAIAFTDAVLVAFPVRSLKRAYVYATSPTALGRLKRLAKEAAAWRVPQVEEGKARLASAAAASDGRLVLEAFDFACEQDAEVAKIAEWLAGNAMPQSAEFEYFRAKLKEDLVLLSDGEFAHFVRHATVVEPHVAINDKTGTADDGKLFYTENLPPETLLAGLVMASIERRPQRDEGTVPMPAKDILDAVLDGNGERKGVADRLLQVGGDATTGRGLVVMHPAGRA